MGKRTIEKTGMLGESQKKKRVYCIFLRIAYVWCGVLLSATAFVLIDGSNPRWTMNKSGRKEMNAA